MPRRLRHFRLAAFGLHSIKKADEWVEPAAADVTQTQQLDFVLIADPVAFGPIVYIGYRLNARLLSIGKKKKEVGTLALMHREALRAHKRKRVRWESTRMIQR